MATSAQLAANRLNAQLSTGPKSTDGKQASSRNAIRHGLYASIDFLPESSREQVELILEHFREKYPQPEADQHLHELALAWFRRDRVRAMEAGFYDTHAKAAVIENGPYSRAQSLAFGVHGDSVQGNILSKFHRWERAFTRDIERTLKTLDSLPVETKPIPGPVPAIEEPRPAEPTRSAPCPCGSGLKYKRCCAAPNRKAAVQNEPNQAPDIQKSAGL